MGFVSIRKMWVDEVGWRTGWAGAEVRVGALGFLCQLTHYTDVVKIHSNLSVESSSLLSFLSRSLSLSVSYILPLSGLVDPPSLQCDW